MIRTLTRRLLLLTVLVVMLPTLALLVYSFRAFERDLVAEIQKNGTAVARTLSRQVDNALGYGIPMRDLYGVALFLDEALRSNDSVRAVALTDEKGVVAFQRGAAFPDGISEASRSFLAEVTAATAERRAEATQVLPAAGMVDIILPVFADGEVAGTLHLGASTAGLASRSLALLLGIATVLAILAFVLHEVLRAMLTVSLAAPTQSAVQVMSRIERGEFTAEIARTNQDEVGRFGRRLNDTVDLVNEHYQRLVALVDAIKASEFDRAVTRQLDAIVQRVRERFSFAAGPAEAESVESGPAHARILLFLFAGLAETVRVFLPGYVGSLAGEGGMSPLLVALPLATFSVVIAAMIHVGPAFARFGDRRSFAGGACLMGLSLALLAIADSLPLLCVARALAGASYALVLQACLKQGDPIGRPSEAVLIGMLLGADLAGPALGGILAEVLDARAALWIAAAGSLLVAGIGVQLIRERVIPVEPQRETLGDNTLVWSALLTSISIGFVLGAAVLFLVPFHYAGEGPAALARIVPLYGLGALAGVALVYRTQRVFPALGIPLNALGLLLLPLAPFAAAVGLFLIGIGFALDRTARDAMIAASGYGYWSTDDGQTLFRFARGAQPLAAGAGIVISALVLSGLGFVPAIGLVLAVAVILGVFSNLLLRLGGGGSPALPDRFYR